MNRKRALVLTLVAATVGVCGSVSATCSKKVVYVSHTVISSGGYVRSKEWLDEFQCEHVQTPEAAHGEWLEDYPGYSNDYKIWTHGNSLCPGMPLPHEGDAGYGTLVLQNSTQFKWCGFEED